MHDAMYPYLAQQRGGQHASVPPQLMLPPPCSSEPLIQQHAPAAPTSVQPPLCPAPPAHIAAADVDAAHMNCRPPASASPSSSSRSRLSSSVGSLITFSSRGLLNRCLGSRGRAAVDARQGTQAEAHCRTTAAAAAAAVGGPTCAALPPPPAQPLTWTAAACTDWWPAWARGSRLAAAFRQTAA